jgi:hypothetical protein
LAGGAAALDEPQGYETDFLTGPRDAGPDRVMAIETVLLALDCASISERDFLARFAGVLPWVRQAYPLDQREKVTKEVFGLFRRHGEAVRQLLIDVANQQIPEVVDQTLSPSSLLALTLKSRLTDLPRSLDDGSGEALPELSTHRDYSPAGTHEIWIAIDEARQRVLIRDLPELKGPAIFQIIKLLVDISLEDRSRPGVTQRYTGLRGREIADRLSLSSEGSVSAAIRRARAELKEAFDGLGLQKEDAFHAVIQGTDQGYRLNPKVQIVEPGDINAG